MARFRLTEALVCRRGFGRHTCERVETGSIDDEILRVLRCIRHAAYRISNDESTAGFWRNSPS
jgi:hypothetical protein